MCFYTWINIGFDPDKFIMLLMKINNAGASMFNQIQQNFLKISQNRVLHCLYLYNILNCLYNFVFTKEYLLIFQNFFN